MWRSAAQGDQHLVPSAKKLASYSQSLDEAVPLSLSALEFLAQHLCSTMMLEETAL